MRLNGTGCNHGMTRYPILYHHHPKIRSRQASIRPSLGLILGWGWHRRGYLRSLLYKSCDICRHAKIAFFNMQKIAPHGYSTKESMGMRTSNLSREVQGAGVPLITRLWNQDIRTPAALPFLTWTVARKTNKSQILWILIRAPLRRALNRFVCSFSKGLNKDNSSLYEPLSQRLHAALWYMHRLP